MTRATRLALVAILLVATGLRLHVATREVAALDGRTLPDDAYISLEIAKQIGQGHGPRFGDVATNGFQPLYVYLMALPFAAADPASLLESATLDRYVHVALLLLAAVDVGSVLLWFVILRRRFGDHPATLLVPLVWALHPTVLATAANGLETSLAVLFLLLVWWLAPRAWTDGVRPGRAQALGLLLGVAAMARLDLLILGAWVGLLAIHRWRRSGATTARTLVGAAAVAGGALVGYLPWLVESYRHSGRLLPVSGPAVRFMSLANFEGGLGPEVWLSMLGQAARALWLNTPALLVAAAVSAMLLVRRREAAEPDVRAGRFELAIPAGFGVLLVGAYALYQFGPWFFPRYLFPVVVPLLGLVALGYEQATRALAPGRARAAHAVAVAVILLACLGRPAFVDLVAGAPDPNLGYRNLGLWAAGRFSPGTVVGASQSGALAYYAPRLRVVNLDGVVDEAIYRSLVELRHLEELRRRGVEYVLGWDVNLRFLLRHSRGATPEALEPVETVPGFRSWGEPWQLVRLGEASGGSATPR